MTILSCSSYESSAIDARSFSCCLLPTLLGWTIYNFCMRSFDLRLLPTHQLWWVERLRSFYLFLLFC